MHRRCSIAATLVGLVAMPAAAAAMPPCSVDADSGAEVCQLTHHGENTVSYYDIPAYSAPHEKIVYLKRERGQPPQIMTANPDGSHPAVVAHGMDPMVSPDGEKIYFLGRSSGGQRGAQGMDVIAFDLRTRKTTPITRLAARRTIQFSPAIRTAKGNLLVYAADNIAHLVYDDGAGDTALQFDDPHRDATFHRLRISPTQPNLIFYNRNVRGKLNPLFVHDTSTGRTHQVSVHATHPLWAPDGLHIAYNGGPDYRFHMTRFDGSNDRVLDPEVRQGTAYCTFAPEGDILACSNWDTSGRYPMPGSIFLLAADGSGRVAYAAKHGAQQLSFWGAPSLNFLADRYHLVFRSDATGGPQVYTVRLPPDIYQQLAAPSGALPPKTVRPQQPKEPGR